MQQHPQSKTMAYLGADPTVPNSTLVTAFGRRGAVIVGSDTTTGGVEHAFYWHNAGPPRDLGVLLGATGSRALGVSTDGTIIVGDSSAQLTSPATRWRHAFRCAPPEQMQTIGEVKGAHGSTAFAVNADGSVIVGSSWKGEESNPDWIHAFLWRQGSSEMQDLGMLPQATGSEALFVSEDGRVVIGRSWKDSEWIRTFRWTGGEMEDIGHF